VLAPATLAALPPTRAIPDRNVFYVTHPSRSIETRLLLTLTHLLRHFDVLAGDGVQFLNCLMRQLKASTSNILSQVIH
jgi:hypothetical protein